MEKMPGDVLEKQWNNMDWEGKVIVLIKALVSLLAKLCDHPLSGIGNIYPVECPSDTSPVDVSKIVSMIFFWDNHSDQDVLRSPFHSTLAVILTFILNDTATTLSRPVTTAADEDEDDDD